MSLWCQDDSSARYIFEHTGRVVCQEESALVEYFDPILSVISQVPYVNHLLMLNTKRVHWFNSNVLYS